MTEVRFQSWLRRGKTALQAGPQRGAAGV
jgi:hypothetical protein